MQTNIMLKATREIIKQYASIIDEDKYESECKESISRAFDTNPIESEILLYLAQWDGYTRPLDNIDFVLTRDEKNNQVKARVYKPWDYYNIVYEFNAWFWFWHILDSLDRIDKEKDLSHNQK